MKLGAQMNSNMLNWKVMFNVSALVQKIKIVKSQDQN